MGWDLDKGIQAYIGRLIAQIDLLSTQRSYKEITVTDNELKLTRTIGVQGLRARAVLAFY